MAGSLYVLLECPEHWEAKIAALLALRLEADELPGDVTVSVARRIGDEATPRIIADVTDWRDLV